MPVRGRDRRADARNIIEAALAAADPYRLVREAVALKRLPLHRVYRPDMDLDRLRAAGATSPESDVECINVVHLGFRPDFPDNLYVIGAGKAGVPMAAAVEDALGDRITAGAVVVKEGHRTAKTSRIELLEAAHPVPDERSCEAARRLLELAGRARQGDLVIFLVSGGGSALTALPAGGLTLEDIRQATEALVKSGASIGEINTVRKHITALAGGQLAAAARPATLVTLIISDVIGDDLGTIASGLTYPDETTYAMAIDVIRRRRLELRLPDAVVVHLEAGAAGRIPETPKPADSRTGSGSWYVLGSNRTALDAAAREAASLGYRVIIVDEPFLGEARDEACRLVARSLAEQAAGGSGALPLCLLAGGEPVVTVTGAGKGGRAQEFALAAALAMSGLKGALLFACGTDGTDGPTDAAGAFADRTTAVRARAAGFDPARHLDENNAYPLFDALGDLIITGPTGTNVNDIFGVLMG